MTAAELTGRKIPHPKDEVPLAPGSEQITASWFDGAAFGLFMHYDHASQQGLETSWPLIAGQTMPPDARPLTVPEYHGSAASFDPANWDPAAIASAAAAAGMTYAVFTARHHSGWSAWPSKASDRTIADSPYGRRGGDLVGEYVRAFRDAGLRVGLYYSLPDWGHKSYPPFTDESRPYRHKDYPRPPEGQWPIFQQYVRDQLTELLTWYGPIDLLWFDGEWERTPQEWDAAGLEQHIRSLAPDIVINDRLIGSGNYRTAEQFIPAQRPDEVWECCMTMSEHWSHVPGDTDYKSADEILRTLVEVVSKGGNLLLNVGPRADGSLPPEEEAILQSLAQWMTHNGEAVHEAGAGLDGGQFYGPTTTCGDRIHLFTPYEPRDALIVRGIPVRQVASVRLLGGDPLPFTFRTTLEDINLYDPIGELRIDVAGLPESDMMRVFRVDLDPGLIQGVDQL